MCARHQAESRAAQVAVIAEAGSGNLRQHEAVDAFDMRHGQHLPHHAGIAQADKAVAQAIVRRGGQRGSEIGQRLRQVACSHAVFGAVDE